MFPRDSVAVSGIGVSRCLLFRILFVLGMVVCFGAGCGNSEGTGSQDALSSVAAAHSLAAAQPRLRVKATEVRFEKLASSGHVTGTVRAFRRARVTAEIDGRVVARIAEPGSQVGQGDALVELDATRMELEMRRSEAALRSARTVQDHAQRDFDRGEQLAAQSAISDQRRDDLRLALDRAKNEFALAGVARDTARRSLRDTRIEAPFEGVVDSIEVDAGDYVSSGTVVATVVDFSRVRIFGGVTAREASRLSSNSEASVSFADLGGRQIKAMLKRISRVADRSDGTFEIELWVEEGETRDLEMMRDGLVAQIELPNVAGEKVLLAPRAALLRRDGSPEVYVVESKGRHHIARSRIVETGRSDANWIEVVSGLEEGDRVVYDGHFALQDGVEIEIDGTTRSRSLSRPSPQQANVSGAP